MRLVQPFLFRLETLLKYRRLQAEQAQVRLGQATAEWLTAQEQLAAVENQHAAHLVYWREEQQKRVTVAELKIFQDFNDKLLGSLAERELEVQTAKLHRQQCLADLEKAARARKLVEKLREKRFLQYQSEVLQQEQKLLDELGAQIYLRNHARVDS